MKTIVTGMCALALTLTGASFAQNKSTASKASTETQQTTKTATGSKTAKTSTEVVSGKVDSFEPGKSISVTVPGKIVKTKSFDLNDKNETVHMASNVKKGDWVRVRETTSNNGHKTVTVSHSKAKAMKSSS